MPTSTILFLKSTYTSRLSSKVNLLRIISAMALTLLLLSSTNIYAQRTLPKSEIDSLWAVWSNPQEEDSNRTKSLHRMAWHGYLFSQPDSAFYFAQLYYDFAEKTDRQSR